MSAETALYAVLAAYAPLTALVSTRIYPDAIPEDKPLPAVVYSHMAQDLLGYTAPEIPGHMWIAPVFGTAVFLYGGGARRAAALRGRFPLAHGLLLGIISIRDLMRAFINVLGIEEPGTLLCIVVEDKIGQLKKIVDAITEERISFGSILVARYWEEGKRAVFPYLLTSNVARVKAKLEGLGFALLNPMQWNLDQLPKNKKP